MTFFLNEIQGPIEIEARGIGAPPPSFWGGVGAAFQKESLEANNNFRLGRETIRQRDDLAVEAARFMGAERVQPMVDALNERARAAGMPERQMPDDLADLPSVFGPNFSEALIEEARNDPDWQGPDISDEALEKRVNERLQKERKDAEDTLNAMGGGRFAAEIFGGLGSAIADIRNLPFLIAGGGSGSIARVMGREAMLNVAAETATLPDRFDMAKRLDIPEPDVAMTLAYAAAGGALFGGAVEGLARGITYWRGTRTGPKVEDVPSYEQQMNIDVAEDALTDLRRPFEQISQGVTRRNVVLEDAADARPLSGLPMERAAGERVSLPFDDWVRGPVAQADIRLPRSLIPDAPNLRATLPVEQITSRAAADAAQRRLDDAARQFDPPAFQEADELASRIESYRGFISDLTAKYDEDLAGSISSAEAYLGRLREENLRSTRGKNAKSKVRQQIGQVETDLHEMRGLRGRAGESADIARTREALTEAEGRLQELAPRLAAARAQVAPEETVELPSLGKGASNQPEKINMPSYDEAVHEYEMARRQAISAGQDLQEQLFELPTGSAWVDKPVERAAVTGQQTEALRDVIAKGDDPRVDMGDGRGERPMSSVLDELDADDEFAAVIDLCGKGRVKPKGEA